MSEQIMSVISRVSLAISSTLTITTFVVILIMTIKRKQMFLVWLTAAYILPFIMSLYNLALRLSIYLQPKISDIIMNLNLRFSHPFIFYSSRLTFSFLLLIGLSLTWRSHTGGKTPARK